MNMMNLCETQKKCLRWLWKLQADGHDNVVSLYELSEAMEAGFVECKALVAKMEEIGAVVNDGTGPSIQEGATSFSLSGSLKYVWRSLCEQEKKQAEGDTE